MSTPSVDDLFVAANWLDIQASAEDSEACQRVRAWLLKQAEQKEFRQLCKEAGVRVADAKKHIKR